MPQLHIYLSFLYSAKQDRGLIINGGILPLYQKAVLVTFTGSFVFFL